MESFAAGLTMLPNEVIAIILSYLGYQNHQIRQVCRLWFDLVDYSHFKLGLILSSEIDDFMKCFSRYNKPIGLTLHKDQENSFIVHSSVTKLAALTQLTYLDITGISAALSFRRLTNLKTLKTAWIAQEDLQQLTNLTKLELRNNIIVTDSNQRILPTSLISLGFSGFNTGGSSLMGTMIHQQMLSLPHVTNLNINEGSGYLLNCAPNVRRLTLRGHAMVPSDLFLTALCELEAETSVSYAQRTTLTRLRTFNARAREWSVESLTNLRALDMEYGWTTTVSPLTNLQSLDIKWGNALSLVESVRYPELLTRLRVNTQVELAVELTAFTNLVDLQLASKFAISSPLASFIHLTRLVVHGDLQYTFLTKLTNLEVLCVETGRRRGLIEPYDFDLQALTRLKKLHIGLARCDPHQFTSVSLNAPALENLTVLYAIWESPEQAAPLNLRGLHTLTRLTQLVGRFSNQKLKYVHPCFSFADLVLLTTLKQLNIWIAANEDLSLLTRLCHLTSLNITSKVNQDLALPTKLQYLTLIVSKEEKSDWQARLEPKLPLLSRLKLYTK